MNNSICNHFNTHQFLSKKTLSLFLFILTILLTACGGSTSENNTTTKESGTKGIHNKEAVKAEPKKVEAKTEPVKAKSEENENLSEAKIKELIGKLKYENDIGSLNSLCGAQNKDAFFYISGQVHNATDKLNSKFDAQLLKFTPQNFSTYLKELISKKNNDEIISLFKFINDHHQNSKSLSTAKLKSHLSNNASSVGLKDYSLCQKDIYEFAKTLSIKENTVVLGWCITLLGTFKSVIAEEWLYKVYNESAPIHIQLLNKLKEKELRQGVDGNDYDEMQALYKNSLPYVKIVNDAVIYLGEIQSQKAVSDIKKNRLLLQSILNEPLALSKNLNGLDSGENIKYAVAKYAFVLTSPYYSHQQALISIVPKEAPTLFKEITIARVAGNEESELEKQYKDDAYKKKTFEDATFFINCLGIEPEISRGIAFGEVLNILNSNFKDPAMTFVIRQGDIKIQNFHADFFSNIKSNDKAYEKVSMETLALWGSLFKLGDLNPETHKWLNHLTRFLPNPAFINGVRNRLEETSGKEFLYYAKIFSNFKLKDSKVIQLIEKAIDGLQKSNEAESDVAMRLKITLKQIKEF